MYRVYILRTPLSAENGGILRATNGNNPCDFGTVAEGFDANETPVATVNNRSTEAQVDNIFHDPSVLALEYKNSGETYIKLWHLHRLREQD